MKFSEKCYGLLKKVPRGKVVTYKQIASMLGSKGYRAVGNAMHRNPNGFLVLKSEKIKPSDLSNKNCRLVEVPCHRVVCSRGWLEVMLEVLGRRLDCFGMKG